MIDFLLLHYAWLKVLHIVAVICWMAGLFYLPRLFVYHAEQVTVGSKTDDLFVMMEGNLLGFIMNPAMFVTWICGLLMASLPDVIDWSALWPWVKLICVLAMTAFHLWLGMRCKDFAAGKNGLLGRRFRIMNEVPTVLMIIIVISVVVRPI